MEKLLNAIASRLNVRVIAEESSSSAVDSIITVTMHMYDYKETSDEVKELFKKELNNHIFNKLQEIEVNESVEYMFECGQVRPLGSIMDDANDNLAEVLQKLPALPEGEKYTLPFETYIRITLTKKSEDDVKVMPHVSDWIREEYFNQ